MNSPGFWTFLLLLGGSVSVVVMMFAITLTAIAFIGAPEDINDVDIDGKPKKVQKTEAETK
jgi:hypothetical protein